MKGSLIQTSGMTTSTLKALASHFHASDQRFPSKPTLSEQSLKSLDCR